MRFTSLSSSRAVRRTGLRALILTTLALGLSLAGPLEKTSIGGYGELHLNYSRPGQGSAEAAILDFHRYVLFFGYDWSEQWAFRSELELEHNFVQGADKGELELEQAYIEWMPMPQLNLRAGVMLPAVGLINERHEPVRFLSVERPYYAKVIVPTTWFGNGAGIGGVLGGMFEYSLQVMEGLNDRKFRAKDALRAGRRKGFKASLENVLTVGSFQFVGMPEAIVGASVALNELTNDVAGGNLYERALLWELHAKYDGNGVVATAEFGSIHYTPTDTAAGQLSNSQGFYADLGYDLARLWQAKQARLIPFVRFTMLNPAGTLAGSAINEAAGSYQSRLIGGVSLQPIRQVAVKLDVGSVWHRGSDQRETVVNAGVGYDF